MAGVYSVMRYPLKSLPPLLQQWKRKKLKYFFIVLRKKKYRSNGKVDLRMNYTIYLIPLLTGSNIRIFFKNYCILFFDQQKDDSNNCYLFIHYIKYGKLIMSNKRWININTCIELCGFENVYLQLWFTNRLSKKRNKNPNTVGSPQQGDFKIQTFYFWSRQPLVLF